MKKSLKFFATLGINQGYGHANELASATEVVAKEWQKAAAEVHLESGVYVGAVVQDSKTVYHSDWGCPVGGEITATISGEVNPLYTDVNQYKDAVITVLKKVAITLKQSTSQVFFVEGDFVYLDFRKED